MLKKGIILVLTLLMLLLIPDSVFAQFKLILNFDDGYRGVYENAFPPLQKAGIPAVVFMPTNLIGKEKHLTLKQLIQLKKEGWEIGSHTVNHPNLAELTTEGLKYEIINSKLYLQEKGLIDGSYASFCSPMTVWNNQIKEIVRANYRVARAKRLFVFDKEVQVEALLKVILKTTRITVIQKWIEEAIRLDQPLILIFHEVAGGGNEYYFPPEKFAQLIPLIKKYDIVTLQHLLTEKEK